MAHPDSPAETKYVPTYFLASLGAGGLVVTFFMYLMFWVPHAGRPVPVFEDIMAAFATGGIAMKASIVLAYVGIAFFSVMNLRTLVWNFAALSKFRSSEKWTAFRTSNAESTLLAAPLAAAMTVNAMFIVGLVFVPRLWSIIEFLFPAAILAFLGLGVWALALIGRFLGRILSEGGAFDLTQHNSFGQLLPAFALSMIGVGLAAPAAMSTVPAVVGLSLILSSFFAVAAILYTLIAGITAFSAMLRHGSAPEAAPTLMIIIPLMTVLGILGLRQTHGLHGLNGTTGHATDTLMFLARLLSVQILFLGLGLVVLARQHYAARFLTGTGASAGSYALVCPGVALSVMMHFFANKGLTASGLIAKFGMVYWSVTDIALIAQVAMILLVLRLNRMHFSSPASQATPVPAE